MNLHSSGPVSRWTAGAALAMTIALTAMPLARASGEGWGINGTYRAQSNGQWAQTNDSYHDENSVVATWTVSTTCSDSRDCTGTVQSDQGWTAPIYQKSGMWYVTHTVQGWEPCADGTAVDGLQVFRFYAATPDGFADIHSTDLYVGEDTTTGVSGACGHNKPLLVTMPFKLTPTG